MKPWLPLSFLLLVLACSQSPAPPRGYEAPAPVVLPPVVAGSGIPEDTPVVTVTPVAAPRPRATFALSEENQLKRLIDSLHVRPEQIHLKVIKGVYTLQVWADTVRLMSFPVVFGFEPEGQKLEKGDGKTPEGRFKISKMYPHDAWHRFMLLDYPNAEYMRFRQRAIREGYILPGTSTGGSIGIHGVPDGNDYAIDERDNWTNGCISLKTRDVHDLYEVVRIGTPVEIE